MATPALVDEATIVTAFQLIARGAVCDDAAVRQAVAPASKRRADKKT